MTIIMAVLFSMQTAMAQSRFPFVLDMVHHNPGEAPFVTKYNNGSYLKSQGFTGVVPHCHINCAVGYGECHIRRDSKWNDEQAWIEKKANAVDSVVTSLKSAGLEVYPFADLVVFPLSVWERFGDEISAVGHVASDGKSGTRARRVNIGSKTTQRLLKIQIAAIFSRFPSIDGLVVRFGETYLQDTPFHAGGNPISDTALVADHILLLKLLREEICVKRNKKLFYRTWDFGNGLHNNPDIYLEVTNQIKPHRNLLFSIKYQRGDFHRNSPFNPTIGIGQHQQIVESQSRMEAYGKGAHPYYIGYGVINGWPETKYEIDWQRYKLSDTLRDKKEPRGLKDVWATDRIVGVMTWSHGGGWQGPHIKHEIWTDLNTFVVAQWALHPSLSEEEIFYMFTHHLGLNSRNADLLRQIALLSMQGVVKGHMNSYTSNNPWWTRDEFFSVEGCSLTLQEITDQRLKEKVLSEKAEASAIWRQIEHLAMQFESPDTNLTEAVRVSCSYGRVKYELIEQIWQLMIAYKERNIPRAEKALTLYDTLWAEWRQLKSGSKWCATLYTDMAFRNQRKGSIGEFADHIRDWLRHNNNSNESHEK